MVAALKLAGEAVMTRETLAFFLFPVKRALPATQVTCVAVPVLQATERIKLLLLLDPYSQI